MARSPSSAATVSGPLLVSKVTRVQPGSRRLKTTQAAARVACPQRSISMAGVNQRRW